MDAQRVIVAVKWGPPRRSQGAPSRPARPSAWAAARLSDLVVAGERSAQMSAVHLELALGRRSGARFRDLKSARGHVCCKTWRAGCGGGRAAPRRLAQGRRDGAHRSPRRRDAAAAPDATDDEDDEDEAAPALARAAQAGAGGERGEGAARAFREAAAAVAGGDSPGPAPRRSTPCSTARGSAASWSCSASRWRSTTRSHDGVEGARRSRTWRRIWCRSEPLGREPAARRAGARAEWGRRWGIWLTSAQPFTAVRRHLRRYLMVEREERPRQASTSASTTRPSSACSSRPSPSANDPRRSSRRSRRSSSKAEGLARSPSPPRRAVVGHHPCESRSASSPSRRLPGFRDVTGLHLSQLA